MSEENTLALYKHASLSGEPIPFDILLSKGLIKQAFTVTAANAIALPADTEILVIYSDDNESCLIQLNGNAVIPANGTFVPNLHFVPASSVKTIDANGATEFGVVSFTGRSGTIIVECARAYKDTRKPKQHSNI